MRGSSLLYVLLLCLGAGLGLAAAGQPAQLPLSTLKPAVTFELGGDPDWMVLTGDTVWISNDKLKAVQRIDPFANAVVAKVDLPAVPCSGLAIGFGSLWVPLAGTPRTLAKVDLAKNQVTAVLPFGTDDDEGGIAVSDDSVWIVIDAKGTLARIDPISNSIRQRISLAPGSHNPLFSDGVVWVTGCYSDVLTAVDAESGRVLGVVHVGPRPRFLAAGDGAIWTLNQGDGSVTRVDATHRRVTATIPARSPGHGGEICFGAGSVWTTVMGVPLTRIDAKTNTVTGQWTGDGGDSVRFGLDSIWLTDLRHGRLWRFPLTTSGLGVDGSR